MREVLWRESQKRKSEASFVLRLLLQGLRTRYENLHLGRNKMDMKDGLNRSEECTCRGANGNVCACSHEREMTALSEPSRCGRQPYRSERAVSSPAPPSATGKPSGEIHLHNLCQQVPNGPKTRGRRKKEWRKHLESNRLSGFNSQLQLTEV